MTIQTKVELIHCEAKCFITTASKSHYKALHNSKSFKIIIVIQPVASFVTTWWIKLHFCCICCIESSFNETVWAAKAGSTPLTNKLTLSGVIKKNCKAKEMMWNISGFQLERKSAFTSHCCSRWMGREVSEENAEVRQDKCLNTTQRTEDANRNFFHTVRSMHSRTS